MKSIKLFFLLISLNFVVLADTLFCQIKQNTKVIFSQNFELPVKSSASLGDVENYRIKINNYGNARFQIEVFDSEGPARIYTDGSLKDKTDSLKWSLWSREILLEVECALPSRR